ncbi:MAG TPA: PaaI family thioesterase [Syntrophobacteraceae bacterium]|nr:PaaI family thioesterase [Syntrophobacteraceae bacterium]
MSEEKYRLLPHRESDNCFACSRTNPSGLKMNFYTDGQKIVSRVRVAPNLSGWDQLVHGGILATMLDEAMGWGVLHLVGRITLTKSMTVDFLKPAYVNRELKVESHILERRGDREVWMEGFLWNDAGELCAKSLGSYALFTAEDMKRRKILNEELIRDVERIIAGG